MEEAGTQVRGQEGQSYYDWFRLGANWPSEPVLRSALGGGGLASVLGVLSPRISRISLEDGEWKIISFGSVS